MKKLIVIGVFALLAHTMMGQQENQPTLKNEVGIHAGFTTGTGLSYRYWFGRAGVQVTALPIKTDSFTLMSGGISFLYTFREMEYMRFYGYVGNHFWKHSKETEENGVTVKHDDSKYNIGFGPALAIGKTLRFNVMAGYGVYDVSGETSVFPTAEIGLYYNF